MNKSVKHRLRGAGNSIAFMGPSVLAFTLVVVIPFAMGIYYSFTKWDGISSSVDFVGFRNYVNLFSDKQFWTSFFFSVRITATITVIANVLGLLFALVLVTPLKLRNAARSTLLLPNIMSGVILGFIWKFIFTKGFEAIGQATGLSFFLHHWLTTEVSAFWAIVIVSVWQWAGYTMIIYIVGLAGVGNDVLEAARIDGASAWKTFWKVRFPLIMPSITICLFWTINRSFAMFDLPFSLTGGGPFNSTLTASMEIYNEAFARHNYGMGSAKAVIFFVAMFIIAMLQVNFTRRKEVEV